MSVTAQPAGPSRQHVGTEPTYARHTIHFGVTRAVALAVIRQTARDRFDDVFQLIDAHLAISRHDRDHVGALRQRALISRAQRGPNTAVLSMSNQHHTLRKTRNNLAGSIMARVINNDHGIHPLGDPSDDLSNVLRFVERGNHNSDPFLSFHANRPTVTRGRQATDFESGYAKRVPDGLRR